MGLFNLGRWLRNELDDVGSFVTGQPAHGVAPAPMPQAPPPQAPQPQQGPSMNMFTQARIPNLAAAQPQINNSPVFHPAPPPQSPQTQGPPKINLSLNHNALLPNKNALMNQSNTTGPSLAQQAINVGKPIVQPLLNADKGMLQGAASIAQLPLNTLKTGAAELTNNPIAQANATAKAAEAGNAIKSVLQFPGQAGAQLGASLAQLKVHNAPGSVTPNTTLTKILAGNNPIPTLQTVKKTQGTPQAVFSGFTDVAGLIPPVKAAEGIPKTERGSVGLPKEPNIPEGGVERMMQQNQDQLNNGIILKETKPQPDGSKIVIKAARNPETGKLQTFQQRVDKNTDQPFVPRPIQTGVNDSRLNALNDVKKEVENAVTDEIMQQQPTESLKSKVLSHGGISSTAYETYPKGIIRKTGQSADYMAQELGFPDENSFIEALNNEQKPLTRTQARDEAISQLESGKHPYSSDYQQMKDAIAQRQDELNLYPKGTYRRVKITNKPSNMSDAEWASLNRTPEAQTVLPKSQRRFDLKSVNSTELDRQAQNILRNGGTPDEAANVYYENGYALGDAVRHATRVARESGIDLGEKDISKNPYFEKIKLPEATSDEQAILNRQAIQKNLADSVNQVNDAARGLSPKDISLLDRLRNERVDNLAKEADNPEQFKTVAAKAKDLTDYQQELGRMLKQNVGYRPNYGAKLSFDVSTPERQQAVEAYKAMLKNNPGYGQRRVYSTYDEASKATNGLLVRRYKNFLEDLNHDAQARANDLGQLQLAQDLTKLHPGEVSLPGEIGTNQQGTFKQLKIAGGKRLSVSDNIANKLNDRAAYEYRQGAGGKLLKVYDNSINAPLKFFKLSLGGFHDLNSYLGFVANQIFAGKTEGLAKTLTSQASPKRFEQQMDSWRNDADANGSNASTLEWANATGLTHGTSEISADVGGSLIHKTPGLKQMHDAMFQREIPLAKIYTMKDYIEGRDITNPSDVAYVRQASRAANYAYGGINRAVEGFTPVSARLWSRALLALDFNEGQARSLINAVSKGGPEGAIARRVMFGRMTILAAPGIVAWMATHPNERKKPAEMIKAIADQFVNPHVPTNFHTPSGIPKVYKLITNPLGKTYRAVAPALDKENPDKTSGLKSEASANSSAGISELLQLKNNKDYYGNPIITKDKNGKLNIAKTAEQVGAAAGPIPISQVQRVAQGKQTPLEAGLNILGLGHSAANPEDPRMKVLNSRQKVYDSQNKDTQAAIDLVHPSWNQDLTQDQKNAIYSNPAYESNKWNVLAHNDQAVAALRKQDAVASANGQPANPLFQLSPSDYKLVTAYEWLKNSDPGTDANNSAAVMYNEHKDLIDKYAQDSQNYNQQMNQIYQQSGGLKGDTTQNNTVDIGGVPHFTVTPEMQDAVNQYFNINDSKQRVDFMAQHPEVQQYFDAQFQYQNDRRQALGEPLMKPYPKAPADVQQAMNEYNALPKSKSAGNTDPTTNRMRSSWIKAHPDLYAKMTQYYAQVDAYNLSKQAGQVQFQGQTYDQKSLKAIQSLGQYDIVRNPDGSLAMIGQPGVQAGAVGTGSSKYGGGSKHYKSKKTPRFYMRRAKPIKIHHSKKAKKVYLQKPPNPVKIKNKTNPHIGIHRTTYL